MLTTFLPFVGFGFLPAGAVARIARSCCSRGPILLSAMINPPMVFATPPINIILTVGFRLHLPPELIVT
jgi:hypothetical protein